MNSAVQNKKQEIPDLFKSLAAGISCEYVSDLKLRANREKIRQYLLHIDTERQYGLGQWEDLADYLLCEKPRFSSEKEGVQWIAGRL